MKSRIVIGVMSGVAVFGAVFAMAASLGGITAGGLGADNAAVSSCETDGVGTSYTTAYDAADSRYEVTKVTVTGLDNACDGKTMQVSVTDSAGASLASGSVTVPTDVLATSADVTFTANPSAKAVANVHIVVSG